MNISTKKTVEELIAEVAKLDDRNAAAASRITQAIDGVTNETVLALIGRIAERRRMALAKKRVEAARALVEAARALAMKTVINEFRVGDVVFYRASNTVWTVRGIQPRKKAVLITNRSRTIHKTLGPTMFLRAFTKTATAEALALALTGDGE